MNKKLIALAVSSALTAPMVMAEDDGPELYGRINLAIGVNDSGDDTVTDVTDVVSRFGIRGDEDLGNGLSAVYRYEFRVNADEGSLRSAANGRTQRLSYVGLKGGFGQVILGSVWSTHFNLIGTHLDPSYTLGYFGYSSYAGGDYRIDNTIQYSGNFGPLTVSADLNVDGSNPSDDGLDRWSVGAKYTAGPVSIAAVYDEQQLVEALVDTATGEVIDVRESSEDNERVAVALAYAGDGFNVNLGYQTWEGFDGEGNVIDRNTWSINTGFNLGDSNRVLLGYWNGEGDGDDTSEGDGILAGFYHSLSSRTKLYFEGHTGDINDADRDVYLFGLRHDF